MLNKEAIEQLRRLETFHRSKGVDAYILEAVDIAIQALEKQIPKRIDKVVKTEHLTLCICPNCGKQTYKSSIGNYYQKCGQRLKLDQ